jgi:hypothetical protein
VAFLRPIVYIRDGVGKIVNATMLNFCPNGICFQTVPLLRPGEKIHIITEENPTDSRLDRTGEAIVGEVMWCREKAGAHRIGVQYLGYPVAEDDTMALPGIHTPESHFGQ